MNGALEKSKVEENEQANATLRNAACCASSSSDEVLANLKRSGLWVDEESYMDYELLEYDGGESDGCIVKPNSSLDIQGTSNLLLIMCGPVIS